MVLQVCFGGGGKTIWAGITRFGYYRWTSHCTFLPQGHHKNHHHPQFHRHTPNFLFIDDNAPPHGARIVAVRLQEVGVFPMIWTAMLPDLNPIEDIWIQLGQRLDDHTLKCPGRTPSWNASNYTTSLSSCHRGKS